MKAQPATINRYHVFLSDLFVKVSSGKPFKQSELCEAHGINKSAIACAEEVGIIDRSKKPFKWKAGNPSKHLAKKLIEYTNQKVTKVSPVTKAKAVSVDRPNNDGIDQLKTDIKALNSKIDVLLSQLGVAVAEVPSPPTK